MILTLILDAIGQKTTKNDIEAFKQRLGNNPFNPVATNPFKGGSKMKSPRNKILNHSMTNKRKTPIVPDYRHR